MLTVRRKRLKILDFDIENRPLSYWIPDQPTAEITAIASCWVGDLNSMHVDLLGEHMPLLEGGHNGLTPIVMDVPTMLRNFVKRYNEADMVTGHYIRKHDLPIINGALLELGMPQLKPKMTCDTRLDMRSKSGVPATQEYLGEILGTPIDKVHMSQVDWRTANRLTPEGIEATRKRVVTDVMQHMLVRQAMLDRGLLKTPKMWRG